MVFSSGFPLFLKLFVSARSEVHLVVDSLRSFSIRKDSSYLVEITIIAGRSIPVEKLSYRVIIVALCSLFLTAFLAHRQV